MMLFIKKAMRVDAVELICSPGLSDFQTFNLTRVLHR